MNMQTIYKTVLISMAVICTGCTGFKTPESAELPVTLIPETSETEQVLPVLRHTPEEAAKVMDIDWQNVTDAGSGIYRLSETASYDEYPFIIQMYSISDELTVMEYKCVFDSDDLTAAEVLRAMLEDIMETYGNPVQLQADLPDHILDADIEEQIRNGTQTYLKEYWNIGESGSIKLEFAVNGSPNPNIITFGIRPGTYTDDSHQYIW